MSELKAYIAPTPDGTGLADYYLKADVDAVLAEKDKEIAKLKDKCQMHDFFWEGCGFKKLGFKNSIDVRDYCDELKRQNEDLLPKCRKANMEVRRLKRALYKACANWACATIYYSGVHESDEYKWENMESKCLKKAEKFKEGK